MGVPFYLAFKYWKPIMKAEKAKALQAGMAKPQEQAKQA